jgi:hypothetical protein
VPALGPAALSDALWALAELGLAPAPGLLERFEEASAGKLLALSPPPRLVRAIATLVRLGRAPDNAPLLLALDDDLAPRGLPPGALSELLWALGRLRFRPGGAWVEVALECALAAAPPPPQPRRGGGGSSGGTSGAPRGGGGAAMSPASWARALEGLAAVGARPPAPWAQAAARATAALLPVLSGEQLLGAARALCALCPEAAGDVTALLGVAPAALRAPAPADGAPRPPPGEQAREGALPGGGGGALKRPVLPPKHAAR